MHRRPFLPLATVLSLCLLVAAGATGCATTDPGVGTEPRPAAPGGAEADAEAAREIALSPYLERLRTLEVEVGGEVRPFLLDTAGGVTLLDAAVAEEVGCEVFGRGIGFRHNGEPVALQRCRGVDLSVGGVPLAGDEVAVWDLMALLRGAPEVGGIVSLKSFEGRTITFDMAGHRLWLETAESAAARTAGARRLTVREARQAGGGALDLFVAVDTPGGLFWFELDSGAMSPVYLAPHTAEALDLDLSATVPSEVELPIAGLGPVAVQAQIKEDLIYDGLLNAAFFDGYLITLDLSDMAAWATPREAP